MIERALPGGGHSPSRRRLIALGAGAAVGAFAGLAPQRATAGPKLEITSGNVQPAPIAIPDLRIYVLSGWFGMGPLSSGMSALVPRLQRFGLTTYHDWNDQQIIVAMNRLPVTQKIVIVGFSLGANELGWIEGRIKRRINLGVAYDPSKQSPLCTRSAEGEYVQTVTQYDRLICYYNPNPGFTAAPSMSATTLKSTRSTLRT
jgi:hypothetical protein